VGFQRIHVLTGEPRYSAAARFFWKTVVTTRSFATGGNADNEHFFPVDEFDRHIPLRKDHGDLLQPQHAPAHADALHAEVTLVPYYRIAHERYNLYWRIVGA
jgi:Beta-L-arabinofuranosidase, GH127